MSLFRPESIEARKDSWLGRPVILPSLSWHVLAGFSLVLVAAAALFLTFGTYTRRVPVAGVILPAEGVTRLVSPQVGWVSDLKVREGDKVARGDVLYTISTDVTTALGNTQDAIADILREKQQELSEAMARQREIDAAGKQMLNTQIAAVDAELPEVEQQIALSEDFVARLQGFVYRQEKMLADGIAISAELESRLQAYYAERTQLSRLLREKVQLESRLSELRAQLAGFDLEAAARISTLRQELFTIEQQISQGEAMRAVSITAPRDGLVTGIMTQAGQTVTTGTPLLSIVPADKPLVAQLLAPSNAIGFVREGAEVLLRYEAFPYQKFGQYLAQISVISRANLRPEEIAQINPNIDPAMAAASLYRITVEPDRDFVNAYGKREPLQAGMLVQAHLLLDSRPLYQWVLEPIYGLRGSLAASAETEEL